MRQRPILKFRPGLERLEAKQLLSATPLAGFKSSPRAAHLQATSADSTPRHERPQAPLGFAMNRITNPTPFNATLQPPFDQVLVQSNKPKPGAVYNVLSISVRNSTRQTFDASNGLAVKVTGQRNSVPILTGDQQWRPGQVKVFYLLTKKYYPVNSVVSDGFQFNFASGTAIPGPSAIFLRVKYHPTKFPNTLNWIVAHGPGSKGHELGLPDTSIWEFIPAREVRVPL